MLNLASQEAQNQQLLQQMAQREGQAASMLGNVTATAGMGAAGMITGAGLNAGAGTGAGTGAGATMSTAGDGGAAVEVPNIMNGQQGTNS